MSKEKEISYEQALKELEDIQGALENNEIPIDKLAEKVKRARLLLSHCQKMLRNVEAEINEIFQDGDAK